MLWNFSWYFNVNPFWSFLQTEFINRFGSMDTYDKSFLFLSFFFRDPLMKWKTTNLHFCQVSYHYFARFQRQCSYWLMCMLVSMCLHSLNFKSNGQKLLRPKIFKQVFRVRGVVKNSQVTLFMLIHQRHYTKICWRYIFMHEKFHTDLTRVKLVDQEL